jgi:hypothetical protein
MTGIGIRIILVSDGKYSNRVALASEESVGLVAVEEEILRN